MNWPCSSPLQKTTMTPVTQMEYILTHQKTELSQVPRKITNKHLPNTNSSWHDTGQVNWQNAQITLSVHKLTLNGRHMSDQLAKCPNSTSCSQMVLDARYTSGTNWKCPNDTQCSQTVFGVRYMSEPTAKCPNNTSCSKDKFTWIHTGRLTESWASQMSRCIFLFHQGKM